jgi:hypothetical protein
MNFQDGTLISTSSGNVFGRDSLDWKWWDHSVPVKLKELYNDGSVYSVPTQKLMATNNIY